MTRFSLLLILIGLAAGQGRAGEYNTVLSIGDEAPTWTDLPGTDGKQHSSNDLKDAKAIVVAFTCNSCPYAVDVEDRLVAFHKAYAEKGVALVAINVNRVDEDRMEAMQEKAEAKQFAFPYLFDESQKVAKDFGAKYTPEFIVLDGKRKVTYLGSFDDSPDGSKVTKTYVIDAVDAVLEDGETEVTETVPIGCRIRFERERRRRKP